MIDETVREHDGLDAKVSQYCPLRVSSCRRV